MRRRLLLSALPASLLGLPACSVLPSYDYVEPRRFALSPTRTAPPASRPGRRVLLVRLMRSAPGMDSRGLRSLRPDGTESIDFYAEWTAPPVELAEEALRRWFAASGLFAGVVTPGSRAGADLVLESELTTLVADQGRGEARAGISAVLLRQQGGDTRLLRQFALTGRAPLASGGTAGGDVPADQRAAAMNAALADALAALENGVARYA